MPGTSDDLRERPVPPRSALVALLTLIFGHNNAITHLHNRIQTLCQYSSPGLMDVDVGAGPAMVAMYNRRLIQSL